MTRRRNDFRFQSDLLELLRNPGCAIANFVGEFCVGRNAWKSQEGIILLKIIVAHGRNLISFSLFAYDFRRNWAFVLTDLIENECPMLLTRRKNLPQKHR